MNHLPQFVRAADVAEALDVGRGTALLRLAKWTALGWVTSIGNGRGKRWPEKDVLAAIELEKQGD